MKKTIIFLTICFTYSMLIISCGSSKSQSKFKRSFICDLKEGLSKELYRFSRDGERFSFISKDSGSNRVIWNNTIGEIFDEIGDVELSQTGLHLMYWGLRESKVFLLRDNKVIGSWPAYSKDDLKRYWTIIGPNDHHWVAGGFSEGGLSWLLIDGKEQSKLDAIGHVVFSKDGLFWGYIGLDKDGTLNFIVNEEKIRSIPDCKRIMLDGSLVNMIIDNEGNIVAAVEPIMGGYQVRYRNDVIAKFGTALYIQGNSLITVVGIQPKEKEKKTPLILSERYIYSKSLRYNNEHLVWVQNVEGTKFGDFIHEVILDGKPIDVKIHAGDNMWLNKVIPVFSPNGDALAFEGRDSNQKWFVWSTKGISTKYLAAGQPEWSLNGKNLAFQAMDTKDEKERQFYVVEGREFQGYENPYLGRFNSDGKIFCFVGKKEDKLVLIMDGNECVSFDELIAVSPSITQASDGLWYIVKEGNALFKYELIE